MKSLLIFLLLAGPVFANCTQTGTKANGGWIVHCDTTGNADQDGTTLFNFLNAAAFPCGTSIILPVPSTWNIHNDGSFKYAWRLKRISTCPGGIFNEITGERNYKFPPWYRVTWADRLDMPKMVVNSTLTTGSSAALFDLFGSGGLGTWYWDIHGLALTTATNLPSNPGTFIVAGTTFGATTSFSALPKNIRIRQNVIYPGEEEAYGPMESVQTINGLFRAPVIPISIYGENIWVYGNYIKGFGGYREETPTTISITSGNNGSPVILSATGLASTFGLSSGVSGCSTGCTGTCWTGFGCRVGVIDELTGSWSALNGWHYFVYESADSVRVYNKSDNPSQPDSTSWGAFPGPVTARRGIPNDPAYGIAISDCRNCKIYNNFVEAWSMTLFTMGNNFATTENTGTTDSGGDTSHLVLTAPPANLKPGDLVKFIATAPSTNYPPKPPSTNNQVCQVVSIAGTTITCQPFGSQGMTHASTVGSVARWNGNQVDGLLVARNFIQRLDSHTLAGKGYMEFKGCTNCLVDGNTMTDNGDGNWFVTTRNQAGNDPWIKVENFTFSNNLMGGSPAVGGVGGNNRLTIQGQDDLATNNPSGNVYYRNNIVPDVHFPSDATYYHMYGGGGIINSGWAHNTLLAVSGSPNHRYHIPQDCFASISYLLTSGLTIRDNIVSYGIGTSDGSGCGWTNQNASTAGNLFWDDLSQGTSTITTAKPGNNAVSNIVAEMVSNCTFANYENCALSPSSTYKGSATDGGDPGADVVQLRDHLNGWSDDAQLISYSNVRYYLNPSTWQIGSTKAIVRPKLYGPISGCTIKLYTDRDRTTLHGDTDTSPEQSCSRSGNLSNPPYVTLVLGANSALTADTDYFYEIADGSRVMVGEFHTGLSTGQSGIISKLYGSSRSGTYSANADLSSGTGVSGSEHTIPIASGAVVYYREGASGPVQAYTKN